jgi:transposase
MKDKNKIEVIMAVMDGKSEVSEAGMILSRSDRQVYRMLASVRKEGIKGLIHKNRGRESPCRIKDSLRSKIVGFVRGKYKDINDTHLKEILKREEGIKIGRETLRQILRKAGILPKRRRRHRKYRKRRERKEAFGVMLQVDASHHDWLEGRGPSLVLVGAIDDATGYTWARFVPAETTWAYMDLMRGVFLTHGMPLSLYSDRHSIFHALREPTIIEQLKNIQPLTQFGRAMEELGIEIIKAWSPQAKGRVERLWGTLQDRLVVELRLAGSRSQRESNQVLEWFLPEHNKCFACLPKVKESLFRKAPSPSQLDQILCLKETRVVNNDHTISFEGLILQIPPSNKFHSIAKQRVTVLQKRDGSIEIMYKQQTVARLSPEAITRLVQKVKHYPTQLKTDAPLAHL